mmetsp:Transcript_6664/g.15444  ORF Transcript_6664/g.15444 Transcript_6664/m.15444 type:complete len:83 (+) Transcript_6664:73-321(+)
MDRMDRPGAMVAALGLEVPNFRRHRHTITTRQVVEGAPRAAAQTGAMVRRTGAPVPEAVRMEQTEESAGSTGKKVSNGPSSQ